MHQHPHSVAVRHVEEGRPALVPQRQGQIHPFGRDQRRRRCPRPRETAFRRWKAVGGGEGTHRRFARKTGRFPRLAEVLAWLRLQHGYLQI